MFVKNATVKKDCINTLADKFYCYSYSADFSGDNKGANKEVRKFVKEQTHNLIDRDFDLSEDTLFTLINTLYIKDVWNDTGKDIPFAAGQYSFVESDGNVKSANLLQGYYERGRVVETDTYTHFYVTTG